MGSDAALKASGNVRLMVKMPTYVLQNPLLDRSTDTRGGDEKSSPLSPHTNQPPPLPPLPNIDATRMLKSADTGTIGKSGPNVPTRKYQNDKPSASQPQTRALTISQANQIPQKTPIDPEAWLYEESEESASDLMHNMENTFRVQSRHDSLLLIDDIIDHCVTEQHAASRPEAEIDTSSIHYPFSVTDRLQDRVDGFLFHPKFLQTKGSLLQSSPSHI